MRKVLFTATITKHILSFHIPFLKWFKEQGFEVHVAAKGNEFIPYCDKFFDISFERSPLKISNINAYKNLKNIINENNYSIIHCHTPIGGAITRLAAKSCRKKGSKIIYTAHGFHFYKGAPLKNWLFFYPIEYFLSRITDTLITINKEDFYIAKRYFKAKNIELINGIGIDLERFIPQSVELKSQVRRKYDFKENDFILIYVGELSFRKHQDFLITAISELKYTIPNIKLLLVGNGDLYNKYKDYARQLGVIENVEFLGFRNDVQSLMMMSDMAVSTSRQEGLPVNVMEAMGTGLPIVVTNCRGNKDLVTNGENGFVIEIDDVKQLAESIEKIYNSEEIRKEFGKRSRELVKIYSINNILKRMSTIYSSALKR